MRPPRLPAAVLALAALGVSAPATAGSMSVQDFLLRADALKRKGALALLDQDANRLRNEIAAAAADIRARERAARSA